MLKPLMNWLFLIQKPINHFAKYSTKRNSQFSSVSLWVPCWDQTQWPSRSWNFPCLDTLTQCLSRTVELSPLVSSLLASKNIQLNFKDHSYLFEKLTISIECLLYLRRKEYIIYVSRRKLYQVRTVFCLYPVSTQLKVA